MQLSLCNTDSVLLDSHSSAVNGRKQNSQFSSAARLGMWLLSVWNSVATEENSMFPTFKMAARILYILPSC